MELIPSSLPQFYENTLAAHLHEVIEEENDLDPDEGNNNACLACTLPVFSTPYVKNESGDFFHECCHQLPPILTQHPLHAKRRLDLHKELPPHSDTKCNNCNVKCEGFFFQCPNPRCGFTLDILCATVVKLLHRSHRHELVPCRSKVSFTCGACKSHDSKESYYCNLCDFSIHRDCASLPTTIQHEKHGDANDQRRHLLYLIYSVPELERFVKFQNVKCCSICRGGFSPDTSMYICTRCSYAAHIKCAVSDTSEFRPVSSQNAAGALLHLPPRDEDENLMHCILEDMDGNNICAKSLHDHDLILHTKTDGSPADESSYMCGVCVKPVSTMCYSCPHCTNFYLHDFCAKLPLKARHPPLSFEECEQEEIPILPRSSSNFFSFFGCNCGCMKLGSGISYECKSCDFQLHPQCALLPEVITHEAHGKSHILFLSVHVTNDSKSSTCNCCGAVLVGYSYECCSCPNFKLHMGCALLPMRVTHKLDRHPLKLSFLTRDNDSSEDFCEVCENPKNTKIWCYGCEECDTLFHTECIPSTAFWSKFIFGGSFRVQIHDCPLRFIRMLTNYSYTCSNCNRNIEGKKEAIPIDGPAFAALECIKCNYWLCYTCAEEFVV